MPKQSLMKRFEAALDDVSSDPRFAPGLLRALKRRGVDLSLSSTYDYCRCFPRTKAPRKQDGVYVCQCCKMRINHDHERQVARELGIP